MKKFIIENKVFVVAVLSAITMAVQQFLGQPPVNFKALGFAVLMAVIGVVANQWKLKGLTIMGILGTVANAVQSVYATGNFTWNEFIVSAGIALLLAATEGIKGIGEKK